MWKKTEGEEMQPQAPPQAQPPVAPPRTPAPAVPDRTVALIGPSMLFKGEVVGEEDLLIEGRVEGRIELRKNSVTVGKNGRVKADIYAKLIRVEGEVQGNIHGEEQSVLHRASNVRGNIVAPRVTLEDGCRFKGSIDMCPEEASEPRQPPVTESEPSSHRPPRVEKLSEHGKTLITGAESDRLASRKG